MYGTEVIFAKEDLVSKKELTSFLIDQKIEFVPDRHKVGNWQAVIKIKQLPKPGEKKKEQPQSISPKSITSKIQVLALNNINTQKTSTPIKQQEPKPKDQQQYQITPPQITKQNTLQPQTPQQFPQKQQPKQQQPTQQQPNKPQLHHSPSKKNIKPKPPVIIATSSAATTATKDLSYSYYLRMNDQQHTQTQKKQEKSPIKSSNDSFGQMTSKKSQEDIPQKPSKQKKQSQDDKKQRLNKITQTSEPYIQPQEPVFRTPPRQKNRTQNYLNRSSDEPLKGNDVPSPRFNDQTHSIKELDKVFKRIMYEQFDRGHSKWFKKLQVTPKYQLSPRSFEAQYQTILNKLLQDRVELMSTEQLMKYYQYIVHKARHLYVNFLRERGITFQSN